MDKTETYKDDFNDNFLSSDWTLSGSGTPANQIKEQNKQLELSSTGSVNDYMYCFSTATYDLTDSYFSVYIVTAGTRPTNYDFLPAICQLNTTNQIWFSISGTTISAYKKVNNSSTQVASTTYVPTTHRWVRIRESSGNIFWDTSPNGSEWTQLGTDTNPFSITAVNIGVAVGQYGAAAVASSYIDNFNFPPQPPNGIYRIQGFQ